MGNWHVPMRLYDTYKKYGMNVGMRQMFYTLISDMRAQEVAGADKERMDHMKSAVLEMCAEYLASSLGNPTWFIDRETLEVLQTITNDLPSLGSIHIPHDAQTFSFEKGSRIGGLPLRSVILFAPRSDVSRAILKEINVEAPAESMNTASFIIDVAESFSDKELDDLASGKPVERQSFHDENAPFDKTARWNVAHRYDTYKIEHYGLTQKESDVSNMITKVIISALMLYSARPEMIREYTLPRSQRYQFHGERKNFRKIDFTAPKKVVAGAPGMPPAPGGGMKAPHYRGWVLRTLRAERYTRNPDGTLKTILVPPTVIHPELMPKD